MRHFFVISLISLVFTTNIFSQTATIHGVVKDANTGELLEDVNIVQPPANGTHSDLKGNYELRVNAGDITLIFSYIGLTADTFNFSIKPGDTKELNVSLQGSGQEIGTIVVSESRVGQKLTTVTQTVDVLSPRLIQANNITNMQGAITKVPGVTVLDGQISIRGGSGYAYGAGSRVTLVVDGMPLMTADRQDIKWPLVPIENVEQLEILKGAASVQYGASALNGVMNITTAYAADTPTTKFSFYYEGFGKPPVDSFKWWKRDGKFFTNPNRIGMNFLHSQKFGDFE
ncbi:MAG: putative vitamin receptor precursor, partial [Bacteroidota bacterium]|nr:putative vitamin receptor precursor [Bacteroidota bacterium]